MVFGYPHAARTAGAVYHPHLIYPLLLAYELVAAYAPNAPAINPVVQAAWKL